MSGKNRGSAEGSLVPDHVGGDWRRGLRVTCPSNLRALPDTNGFFSSTQASLSRYLKSKVPDKRNILFHVATHTHTRSIYLVATLSVASTTMS